mgnify:CR=1 FL=1
MLQCGRADWGDLNQRQIRCYNSVTLTGVILINPIALIGVTQLGFPNMKLMLMVVKRPPLAVQPDGRTAGQPDRKVRNSSEGVTGQPDSRTGKFIVS